MARLAVIAACLILLSIASAAGCLSRDDAAARTETTQTQQQITAEQARAALLNLESIRVLTGGEDDPIFVDLQTGTIAWTNESTVKIGRFISCNLKDNTWQMTVGNPRIHFHADANGIFERESDGTWRAIQTGASIT
jgi:hypothetical protein